ncbi:MAG TPA: bifunctional NADH dehydrogenase FAD-containing subunit/selenide, water dikinase SelD, partial [Gammaproteobacteria bacterium]|nr:bifunctional NADH dehydrogenase FAD-containing subunit/selenide, water dikinase SelD [Gammaproteobacteria bacterium]
LYLDRIPLLPGVRELLARGWVSSLHAANRRWTAGDIDAPVSDQAAGTAASAVLFDPQTAGPLIASVPPQRADACVGALRDCGYERAAVVGEVSVRQPDSPIRIRLSGG